MNALKTALNTKFKNTSSLTTAFTGNTRADASVGLYWDVASKGSAPPYLVVQIISAPTTTRFGGAAFADIDVLFKGFAVGSAQVVTGYMETLIAVLDDFLPTLTAGKVANVQRLTEAIPSLTVPTARNLLSEEATGDIENMAMVTYRYTVSP